MDSNKFRETGDRAWSGNLTLFREYISYVQQKYCLSISAVELADRLLRIDELKTYGLFASITEVEVDVVHWDGELHFMMITSTTAAHGKQKLLMNSEMFMAKIRCIVNIPEGYAPTWASETDNVVAPKPNGHVVTFSHMDSTITSEMFMHGSEKDVMGTINNWMSGFQTLMGYVVQVVSDTECILLQAVIKKRYNEQDVSAVDKVFISKPVHGVRQPDYVMEVSDGAE